MTYPNTVLNSTLMINVGLVEDDHEVRQGYAFLIEQAGDLRCHPYGDAETLLSELAKAKLDVVLMDVNLPGMSGIECTRIVKQISPNTQVMMFTVYENNESVFQALEAGASGYVLKHSSPSFIVSSIMELYEGGAPMSSQIARKVVTSFNKRQSTPPTQDYSLSAREEEVLDLLSQGFRYQDIADKLFISIATVRSHIYHIYEKLHVKNRTEALIKWKRS
jgi:DNA-binding NarL/FixJ family response regulator